MIVPHPRTEKQFIESMESHLREIEKYVRSLKHGIEFIHNNTFGIPYIKEHILWLEQDWKQFKEFKNEKNQSLQRDSKYLS